MENNINNNKKMFTPTTYSTIEEAFANGSGDQFYTKNGRFACVSRHADLYESLIFQGFELKILTEQELKRPSNEKTNSTPENFPLFNMAKSYSTSTNGRDGYYDEFPDAYGQTL